MLAQWNTISRFVRVSGRTITILVSVIAVLALGIYEKPALAGASRDRLDAFFKTVKTMRAEYQLTVLDPKKKVTQNAGGTFLMERPNKFRWDYNSPYEQVIVSDGAKIWVYDKDLEQVTVKKLDEALGNTPALLLAGSRSLDSSFKIVEINSSDDGLAWVELIPTAESDSAFSSLRLGFGPKSVEAMELVDSFGQTTKMKFKHVETNVSLAAQQFQFTPPAGVDVVGDQ